MLGLLNTVLSKGNTLLTYVKDGLVMANRFLTPPKLTFPVDASAEFNGTSDYIQVKDDGKDSAFDTQEFTIGAWVYFDSLTNDFIIWSYDFTSQTAPYYAQHLRISSGVNKLFFGFNQSGTFEGLDGGNALSLNKWYYATATYKSGEQKIYIDGSQIGSESNVGTITYYNQEVWIGRSNYSYANGNLANVAFWNRALSSDEINSVMWKTYEQVSTTEKSGLQAWYKLSADEVLSGDSTATLTTYANANALTFEAPACVQTALNGLPDITDARLYSANYDIRVKADGGTVESLSCVETELNAIL